LVAIVGGAKVFTKLSILRALAVKVDQLVVGVGIANTFMMVSGLSVGKSLVEESQLEEAREVIRIMKEGGAEVPIPVDVVFAKSFAADAAAEIKTADQVQDDDMILDVGPQTAQQIAD